MKKDCQISDLLKPLCNNPAQAYLTDSIQFADILEWILQQVGKSEIWITSFSISEEFLRRLFFIKQKGNISDLSLVLDFKATQKTLKLWAFIQQVISNTFLADNHSKILLVKSSNGDMVSVITSQNLTRGNRNESSFISTDKQIFISLHQQIQHLIYNNSIPINELFRISDTAD